MAITRRADRAMRASSGSSDFSKGCIGYCGVVVLRSVAKVCVVEFLLVVEEDCYQ